MRGRSTKLWELERAEARGGSKLNNIFSSFLVWANASNGLGQTKQGTQPEEKRENNNRFIEIVLLIQHSN